MRKFIFSATLLLALSQLFSRILGVVRDRVFAHVFGVGGEGIFNLDIYFAAFRLPDLVYNLLIFGSISAAFVPLLCEKNSHEEKNEFASNVLNVLFFLVLVLAGGIFILAEPLTRLITPGFSSEEILLTSQLLRIQLLAPIFFTFSAVFGGLAQHFHKFFWYSLAPILYNLGIIFGALLWGKEFGVFGISWGVALGAFLHASIQLPGIFSNSFRWVRIFQPKLLCKFFKLASPRMLSLVATQFQFVVITIFASFLGGGSLAIFNYSWNLASLPLGVVGIAFATSSFATLSRLSCNFEDFRQVFQRNFLGILFWVVPASVGLFFLRNEITTLILKTGEFATKDVGLVSNSLAIFAFAIPLFSLLPLLNNVFFAQKNTRIPLLAGSFGLIVAIFSAKFFVNFESASLAIAYSLASLTAFSVLFFFSARNFSNFPFSKLIKILCASAFLGVLVWFLRDLWKAESLFQLAWKISGIVFLSGGFYFASTKFLKLNPRKIC
ncbi:murein biosynthesis integral membrane protein MurJ [Candidatus Gracilibacteria bacterium]|nr:murein biosynthesis integral membrane protein MurJ [Candidatus Gracilibacteria bacterium]